MGKKEYIIAGEDIGEKVRRSLPEDKYLYDLAELFKVFGDSTRIKILYALFQSDLCVGDIAGILNISQPTASHQLKILKDARLVKFRKTGKSVIYTLDDAVLSARGDVGAMVIAVINTMKASREGELI